MSDAAPSNPSPAAADKVAAPPTPLPQEADPDAQAGLEAQVLPRGGLRSAFLKGMVWNTLSLLISKFSSLIATVALGTKFDDAEYGSFAGARGSAMIGDVLTDGGMRRVLITRGTSEYARIGRTAFHVSLAFNLTGCALMCGTAGFVHRPGVAGQLIITGIAMLLATFGSVQRARLAMELRFARSAFMYTISNVMRNVLTIAFAFCGLGPLSFALPVVFVALWEAFYARRIIGPLPRTPPDVSEPKLAAELLHQGKWVMLAMIGSSLVARGDYLVASSIFPPKAMLAPGQPDVAGQYMYAFQLTIALFSPLTIALATVIQPVMAQLRSDPARQAEAFRRMVRLTVFLATPASLLSMAVTPLLIHPIKHGFWDVTVPAIQILAATECVRQLYQMSIATLEAAGRFHTSAFVVIIDGLLTVVAALIGCLVGHSLLSLMAAVAIERTLTAIAQAVYTDKVLGGTVPKMLGQILPPLVVGAVVAVGLGAGVKWLAADASAYRWLLCGAGVVAVPLFFALSMIATPRSVRESYDLFLARFARRLKASAGSPRT